MYKLVIISTNKIYKYGRVRLYLELELCLLKDENDTIDLYFLGICYAQNGHQIDIRYLDRIRLQLDIWVSHPHFAAGPS